MTAATPMSEMDKPREIEIILKMLTMRWPVAAQLSVQSMTDICNAFDDYAQYRLAARDHGAPERNEVM